MSHPSRMVITRQVITKEIAAQARQHAEIVDPELRARFGPDGPSIDWTELVDLLVRHLQRLTEQMIEVDDELGRLVAHDFEPRSRRDRAAARVRERLITLRIAAETFFGQAAIEVVPIAGKTALQPDTLWLQANHTVQRIRDGELPPTIVPGGPSDLGPWFD
ncbi:MAG: hypothetical protein AAGD38_16025, partial [Acidobacteriota bacterium]